MQTRVDFRFCLVTDRRLFETEEGLYRAVELAVAAGAGAVQLREKDLGVRDLLRMAHRLREITEKHKAALFVNDRVDVALASGADGVHLGGASMPAHAAKRVSGGRLLVGVSAHAVTEAEDAARSGADFVFFGPVFATPSKMRYGNPVGIALLAEAARSVPVPVIAIGGITKENAAEVMQAGAHGVAAISAVLGANCRESDIREFIRKVQ